MIQRFDIPILIQTPRSGHVDLANFLALIDIRCATLQRQKSGEHLSGKLAVFRGVGSEARDTARLVVVFEVEGIPAVVGEHHGLPF